MRKDDIIRVVKDVILNSGIKKAYLFGSFLRAGNHYNDIDIVIEPPEEFTLLDLAKVANRIEEKIGVPVDLVTLRAIHPKLKGIIKEQMVAI